MAPLTVREVYRSILDASVQSAVVTGIELLLLDEPVLKLRAHLGTVAFIDVFFNAETGKRHLHPFDSPASHHSCEEMSFESFLRHVENNKEQWERR
jgi:hypothetical protein